MKKLNETLIISLSNLMPLSNNEKIEILQYIDKQDNEIERLNNIINKGIEYINKFDDIRAYYEYIDEDGYDEYNFDEDFKKDMLDILKGEDNENI